jgi:hypothetical protein
MPHKLATAVTTQSANPHLGAPARRVEPASKFERLTTYPVSPPSAPPRTTTTTKTATPPPHYHQHRGDYDPLLVGCSLEDSFKVLWPGLGATETEVKVRYRALAQIYHPDKHDPAQTGLTHLEASQYFQLINNANSYLCEIL